MAFYLHNARYATTALGFSANLPATCIEGDAAAGDVITITLDLIEDVVGELRDRIHRADQGINGLIEHGEYQVDFVQGRLVEALTDVDYGRRHLRMVFSLPRENIRRLVRPQGQPKPEPATPWFQSLWVYSQDLGVLNRRRIELDAAFSALEDHRVALDAAFKSAALRKEQLWASGEPEWVEQALARGH